MNLQEQQAPIDKSIVDALITATPEHWSAAEMVVDRFDEPPNERLSISISSPQGNRDLVGPTNEIYEGLYRLSDCFRVNGMGIWKKATYRVNQEDGSWRYQVDFEY